MGERMVGIHDLRGEHGRDHVFEILLDVLVLFRRQVIDGEAAQPLGAQALGHVGKGAVAALVQRLDCGVDAAQLFPGGHAGFVVDPVFVNSRHIAQAAHTDHEEFVQIACEDGQEFAPLEQRDGIVLRLGEHAGVELQPRKLAVLRIALFPDCLCHAVCPPVSIAARGQKRARRHIINQYTVIILHFWAGTMPFSVKIM